METFLVILWGIVLIKIQIKLYKKVFKEHITYECILEKDKAMEGERIQLVEILANTSFLPMTFMKSEIVMSRYLDVCNMETETIDGNRRFPSVFILRGHQKITRKWEIIGLQRGEWEVKEATLMTKDLLGLDMQGRNIGINQKILILPTPLNIETEVVKPSYLNGDTVVKHALLVDPFYRAGIRKYTERDSFSQINWKATAKAGELMANAYEFTLDQNITLLFNIEQDVLRKNKEEILEKGIKAVAYFVEELTKQDIPIAFISNGTINKIGIKVEKGSGKQKYLEIGECLAKLEVTGEENAKGFFNTLELDSTHVILLTLQLDKLVLDFIEQSSYRGIESTVIQVGEKLHLIEEQALQEMRHGLKEKVVGL